jgi:DNA invertase Pin-like site-specific DNA recombinase
MIYGYIRVSTDEQTDGTSLHTQKLAIKEKHHIDQWLEDGGISGSTFFFDRPSIQGINFQAGDEIICYTPDRWSRDSLNSLKALKALTDVDVQVTSITTGKMNKCSSTENFVNTLMGGVSQLERENIIERCARGRNSKRGRCIAQDSVGGFVGGRVPFLHYVEGEGKESELYKIDEYDEVVDDIFDMKASAIGYRSIAKFIHQKYGIETSHMTIKRFCEKGRKSIH